MIVCAGSILGFGSFAEDLKRNLEDEFSVGREAQQQAHIAMCGNLGLWIGSFIHLVFSHSGVDFIDDKNWKVEIRRLKC